MDSKDINRIAVLEQQFKDLRVLVKGNQTILINQRAEESKELEDIKIQLQNLQHSMSKLIGDIRLIDNSGKIKTSYKDYSDEEIYNIRMGTTLDKAAVILNCSKSTVQSACRRYREQLREELKQEANEELKEKFVQVQMIANAVWGKPVSENVEKQEDKSTIQFDDDIIDF